MQAKICQLGALYTKPDFLKSIKEILYKNEIRQVNIQDPLWRLGYIGALPLQLHHCTTDLVCKLYLGISSIPLNTLNSYNLFCFLQKNNKKLFKNLKSLSLC